MGALAPGEKQQERVIVEGVVAVEDTHGEPPRIGQRGVEVLAVEVEPKPGRRARAIETFGRAGFVQVPAESVAEGEGGQVGFAVYFGLGVTLGIGGEGSIEVNEAPARCSRTNDAKAQPSRSCWCHGVAPWGLGAPFAAGATLAPKGKDSAGA